MKPVRSGPKRYRLEVQVRNKGEDDFNAPIGTWMTAVKRWCSIEPMKSDEIVVSQQQENHVTHRIKHRFYKSLTTEMRYKKGSRIFNIGSIINTEEQNREQIVSCIEVLTP